MSVSATTRRSHFNQAACTLIGTSGLLRTARVFAQKVRDLSTTSVRHSSLANGSSAALHAFPEKSMSRNGFVSLAFQVFVLCSVSGARRQTLALDAKAKYPGVAALDQYLMADRNAKIALAQSRLPDPYRAMQRSLSSTKAATRHQLNGRMGSST